MGRKLRNSEAAPAPMMGPAYLALLELEKRLFYGRQAGRAASPPLDRTRQRRIRRGATRWTVFRVPPKPNRSRRRRTAPAQQHLG